MGKSIYFTDDELFWILLSMSNQDAVEEEKEEEMSMNIINKIRKAQATK